MQNMNISMAPYTQTGAFLCSQYDVGREGQITLVDQNGAYTIPTGATVTLHATKPSGLGFTVECTWTGNTVSFSTTSSMTAEYGRFPAEIRIEKDSTILGSANFFIKVEKSPHPDDVIDGDTIIQQNLVARVTTLETKMETVEADLTDVKADLQELIDGGTGSGLTEDVKVALLNCFDHVTWDDDDPTGQSYIDALEQALYPPADLVSISAVYTQGGTVYDNQTLDSLKADLVVTAHMSDSTTQTVTTYTLSGTLATGTSTITVAYGGKTTTFTVTVTHAVTQYSITNNLTNCTNSNSATVINEETAYSGTLTATSGNIMSTVAITMGGTDVTSTAYNSETGAISIASVTGNVVITAEAVEDVGWLSGVPYDMTNGLTENMYLNNGVENTYNGWSISPYLPCKGAFIISDTVFSLNYCAGYDESGTFKEKLKLTNANIPFNYDDKEYSSIRVSDSTSKVTGATITPYKLPNLGETTVYEASTYYVPTAWTTGGYINTNTGAVVSNASYKYTDFMNCYNASTITDNIGSQVRGYAFYDGNKDFISGVEIALADQTYGKQTSVPNGARYFKAYTIVDGYGLCFKLD